MSATELLLQKVCVNVAPILGISYSWYPLVPISRTYNQFNSITLPNFCYKKSQIFFSVRHLHDRCISTRHSLPNMWLQ